MLISFFVLNFNQKFFGKSGKTIRAEERMRKVDIAHFVHSDVMCSVARAEGTLHFQKIRTLTCTDFLCYPNNFEPLIQW